MIDITFGICGTAGRNTDQSRLTKKHFESMCIVLSGLIDELNECNYKITTLVSGGAPWADHSAVQLFLDKKVSNLRLFLPAKFECGTFVDNGRTDSSNYGGILNSYHKKFQNVTHINSLTQIQIAKGEGAELIHIKGGFHARNAFVAKSDIILAMTFGNKHEIKAGGTAHTIKCYLDRVRKESFFDKSFHYDLNSGQIYEGCTLPKPIKNELSEETLKTLSGFVGKTLKASEIVGFHTSPP